MIAVYLTYKLPQQLKAFLIYFLFLRHGDCSNDTATERNPREEHFALQGWCSSLCTSKFVVISYQLPSVVLCILIMKQVRKALKLFSNAVIFVSWQMNVLLFHTVIANFIVIFEDKISMKIRWWRIIVFIIMYLWSWFSSSEADLAIKCALLQKDFQAYKALLKWFSIQTFFGFSFH